MTEVIHAKGCPVHRRWEQARTFEAIPFAGKQVYVFFRPLSPSCDERIHHRDAQLQHRRKRHPGEVRHLSHGDPAVVLPDRHRRPDVLGHEAQGPPANSTASL
ncbi:MAG: hypothetical protein U0935_00700 [Pirellulales bacterium]